MAGKFFDQRQGNIDPWGRGNSQDERFDPWMGQEDRSVSMRREQTQMDMDRQRSQMAMRRDEMNNPRQPDWYDGEDFLEERFRNERVPGNFPGQEMRNVRRGTKRQKTQQRFDDMADSLFQNEAMQNRSREKDYAHDGISGPYTDPVWDRQNPARDEYYHKPSMGIGDGDRDRNAVRYEDGPQSRQPPNYNFDFTDKGGANMPAGPVTGWNKPALAGGDNALTMSKKQQKKKKKEFNPNWDAEPRMAPSGGESLYTRRPRQPEEQPRHEGDLRSNWDDKDRPITNMDVYRARMATQAKQQKSREEDSQGSRFREKGDLTGDQSTHSVDSDEFLYQDKPVAKQSTAEERKDPFWENLSKRSDEPKAREKADPPKQATSIGEVLVETLLKHISQTVDSGKQSGSGLQKDSGKSTDLAQQLMNMLSNTTDSRPKEEPKEVRKTFETRPPQGEPAFKRQNDNRTYPANAVSLPEPATTVNSNPGFDYRVGNEYPPVPAPQYPYAQQPLPATLLPVSQPDYQYGLANAAPPMQSAYISHSAQPSLMPPPPMRHQMLSQPIPPPIISPFPPRPHIPSLFPNFPPVSPVPPATFMPAAALRAIDMQTKNMWRAKNLQNMQNNATRRSILTPIPQKVDKRNDKAPAPRQPNPPGVSKNFAASTFKVGFDKPRPFTVKITSASTKATVSTSKVVSRNASSTSKTPASTSRDGYVSASKSGSSASKEPNSKNGNSASKDAKSTKDASATERSARPQKAESCPVPKTAEERKAMVEQEVQLKKKVELLHVELNRLKNKCASRMQNLHANERSKDLKLNEARKLQSEIKAHVESAKDELQAVRKALKASQHLLESARKERASALPTPDATATAEPKQRERSKSIVLNLKSGSHAPTARAGSELKPLDAPAPGTPSGKHYRFTDNGDHWCKHCDIIMPVAEDLLKHLQRKHYDVMQRIPPTERPWAEKPPENKLGPGDKFTYLPFRGAEFMIPCDSFFCNLCKELFGDACAARNHLESLKHNANYSKFCKSNPSYAKQIQSVLNAQKKQDKKVKNLPVVKTKHEDVDILPLVTKKEEPEIIDIDDDDASAGAGKQSPKSSSACTAEKVKDEKAIVDATKKPVSTDLDNKATNEKEIVETDSKRRSNKSKFASSGAKKSTEEEDVFEKVSDDELIEDTQHESGGAQESHRDSAEAPPNDNVFDKISDDEMVEDAGNDFEMITDDEAIGEDVSDKKDVLVAEHATEDAVMKDENAAAENVDNAVEDHGEYDLEDFGEDADITIIDDADNENDESAEIVIEDDVDDDNDDQGIINEDECLEVPGDEEEIIDHADVVDERAENVAKEDEVVDNADGEDKNADEEDEVINDADDMNLSGNIEAEVDEVVDDAGEEVGIAHDADKEDEVVHDAGEEHEVVDDAGVEDEVVDDAGKEHEVVDDAGVEDEVVDDAGEEHEVVDDAGEEHEVVDDAGEEHEVVDDAGVEDEVIDDAGVADEVVDDANVEDGVGDIAEEKIAVVVAEEVAAVATEGNEVKDAIVEKLADVPTEMEEGTHVVDEVEEGADIAAEDALADIAQNIQNTDSNNQTNMDASATIQKEETDNVSEADDVTKENPDEGHDTSVTDNMDTGDVVGKDANSAASENVDASAIKEGDIALIGSTVVTDNDRQDKNYLVFTSSPNKDVLLQNAVQGTAKVLVDTEVATVEFPSSISSSISEAIIESSKNFQEGDIGDKDIDPSNVAVISENQSESVDLETSVGIGHSQILAQATILVEGDSSPKVSEVENTSSVDPLLESTSEKSCLNVSAETISENQGAPPAKRRQMAICSRGRGRVASRGRGRANAPQGSQGETVSQEKLQSKGEDEDVAPEPVKKIVPSKYTRAVKLEPPTPTRVGTRSSRQAMVEVVKIPEAEVLSRPRRQTSRAKALAGGVKRDQGGRPLRGKTALEDDVIDLSSPEPSDLKKAILPEVIAEESKPSIPASGRRCRQKITPKRAELEAAKKVAQKGQDITVEENPTAEAVPWQITEVVTLVDEEAKKLNLEVMPSSGIDAVAEPEEMETSMLLESGEGSNLVDLSAEEDDAKLEKMEAILLGDPFISSEIDEADDACLESDLEIVDEAEDTD